MIILLTGSIEVVSVFSSLPLNVVGTVFGLESLSGLQDESLRALIVDYNCDPSIDTIAQLKKTHPTVFIASFYSKAVDDAFYCQNFFHNGGNMVSSDSAAIVSTIQTSVLFAHLSVDSKKQEKLSCPFCPISNLSATELWFHIPAFHVTCRNDETTTNRCPICLKHSRGPLSPHIHERHRPSFLPPIPPHPLVESALTRRSLPYRISHNRLIEIPTIPRPFVPERGRGRGSGNYVQIICRHPVTGKYLLAHEYGGQGFGLPGGAVDGGETFTVAIQREGLEEVGITFNIKGILCVSFDPSSLPQPIKFEHVNYVIFYGEPAGEYLEDPLEAEESNLDNQLSQLEPPPPTTSPSPPPPTTSPPPLPPPPTSLNRPLLRLPKTIPDYESAGSCWCSVDEILGHTRNPVTDQRLRLRNRKLKGWVEYVEEGGEIFPLHWIHE